MTLIKRDLEEKEIKISVIIPVYNAEKLIVRCLDSVLNQTYRQDIEIIAIDDGSTDNSLKILESYSDKIRIYRQVNQGPASARNKGIEKAKGKYLAFLDADDYWEENFLIETISFIEKNDVIAVSVGQIHKIIGKQDQIMPKLVELDNTIPKEGIVLSNFFQFWAENNHVCTGSVVMSTTIAKETGGQRTDLRVTEDLEFWAYMATFGKWGFIPKVLFISDGGEVTKAQGWLKKNKKRWASAPTIESWEERITDRLPKEYLRSYTSSKEPILKNLTLSMILSGRAKEARQMIARNIEILGGDKVSLLLKLSSYSRFSWYIFSKLLMRREYNRKL